MYKLSHYLIRNVDILTWNRMGHEHIVVKVNGKSNLFLEEEY